MEKRKSLGRRERRTRGEEGKKGEKKGKGKKLSKNVEEECCKEGTCSFNNCSNAYICEDFSVHFVCHPLPCHRRSQTG